MLHFRVRIAVTVHRIRLGVREFRVICPGGAPLRACLRFSGGNYTVFASSGAAMRIAAFWEIAARSPHSLVYLRLRGDGTAPRGWHDILAAYPGRDLLLAPQWMRFPGHEWKRLRARLGHGGPATFTLPPKALDPLDRDLPGLWHRENTRRLDLSEHADTLIVAGDGLALRYGRDLFTHVGRHSLHASTERCCLGWSSNEIHESDAVLRRHDAGLYLWIPRDQRWI